MVTSRAATGPRPVFPYKSRAYTILYFGTSVRRVFTTQETKASLPGVFPKKKNNIDFVGPARKLVEAGLLKEVGKHKWSVTHEGVKAMVLAAAYYREFKTRTLGNTYMRQVEERIRQINATSLPVDTKLDMEDEILEEVQANLLVRQYSHSRRKGQRNTNQ